MQNSIHSSINSINAISSNGLIVNGKMYRYNAVATISANTASAQNDAGANSSYSGLIKTGNLTSSIGGAPILTV